jgi:general stress protein YciG
LDGDRTGAALRHAGGVELQVGDLRGRHRRGRVGQVAVEQFAALELGRVGDAVDGGEDQVDFLLVGDALVVTDAGFVARAVDQVLEVGQQGGDLAQPGLGNRDDVDSAGHVGLRGLHGVFSRRAESRMRSGPPGRPCRN